MLIFCFIYKKFRDLKLDRVGMLVKYVSIRKEVERGRFEDGCILIV